MSSFDHIVIGAGIQGCSTAWKLASDGKSTLLIEQHELNHEKGSSCGKSRIIRYAYESNHYTNMMVDAYKQWADIEKATDTTLYKKTGVLILSKPPYSYIDGVSNSLDKHNLSYEILDNAKAKKRFPQLSYSDDYKFLVEHQGGVLMADQCMKAIQKLYLKEGGKIKDKTEVFEIKPSNYQVNIMTSKGEFQCKSLVLCLGPWAGQFIKTKLNLELPLQPMHIDVYYWKEKETGSYSADNFMPMMDINSMPENVYSLPSHETPGHVKLAYHWGPTYDPSKQESRVLDKEVLKTLKQFIKDHYPGIECDKPSDIQKCAYTMTPNQNFILDKHPSFKNIVIGAGFSGTGFKLGPVVGQILADLAQNKTPEHDLTPFTISQFKIQQTT